MSALTVILVWTRGEESPIAAEKFQDLGLSKKNNGRES